MANVSTVIDQLVINKLSQAKYEELCSNEQLNPNQLYITDYNPISDMQSDIGTLCAQFDDYWEKTQTSSAAEISDALIEKADISALDAKITIDDQISGICAQTDLSIVKLSADDYAQLVATSSTVSNCLYIVEDDIINAYGQQISNLAPGTSLSDAVNLEQLCDAVSSIQMPSDLSSFTNSPGYLSSIPNTYKTYSATVESLSGSGYALKSDIQMSYHQNEHKIVLSSGINTTSVDCADFIKDGMLSAAELCGTQLVLTFNTDAGSQPISVELSNFVDNYDEKLDKTSYYCPEWRSGEVYKGTAEEPNLYRVAYDGKIWRANLSSNLTSTVPPPNDLTNWTNVTNAFFNNYPGCRAEGFGTLAAGEYSHAEGYRTYAVTEGNGATGAHAEGSRTIAVGDASHAEGRRTLADMHAAHAEGLSSYAHAQYSHAEGDSTIAYSKSGHAEGHATTAGLSTDVEGTTADVAAYAHAEGENTLAIGLASHAEGGDRTVGSTTTHTIASAKYAHAEGGGTTASAEGAHSEGGGTTASKKYAHAEGLNTVASGQYSHAEGSGSEATADGTHVEGLNNKAQHTGTHVEGRYARSAHTNSFIWSGKNLTTAQAAVDSNYYKSQAQGSFNINPVDGISGFYIGTQNLPTIIDNKISSTLSDYKSYNATLSSLSADGYATQAWVNQQLSDIETILNSL